MSAHLTRAMRIGTELPELVVPPLQRQTFADYAAAANDHSAIHLDPEAAQAAGFPDVFGQGMLSMAYLGRAVRTGRRRAGCGHSRHGFVAIARLGDRLTYSGTLAELFDEEGERRARLDLVVVDQSGEVKLRGTAVVGVD